MVDKTRPSFGDKSQKGAYEEVIHVPTSSHIYILDLGILLVLTSRIYQNGDIFFPYFSPNVYALAFLRI